MKKIIVTFTILIFIIVAFIYNIIQNRLQCIEEISYSHKRVVRQDSSYTIAVVGDSWADNGRKYNLGKMIDERFKEAGIISQTFVAGVQGAKTSQIYQNLFNDTTIDGMNYIISKNPHYCILLMGLNDLNGQYGQKSYTHNTLLIVKYLNSRDIIPIIYNIPDVNYLNLYHKYPQSKQIAYRILSFITSGKTSLANRLKMLKSQKNLRRLNPMSRRLRRNTKPLMMKWTLCVKRKRMAQSLIQKRIG